MRLESPAFTETDLRNFLAETLDHERRLLATRLEADSQRLATLVKAGAGAESDAAADWSGHDVLAHIVVLSKFYGTLTYLIGSGKVEQVDWLNQARMRDVAAEQLTSLPPTELLRMAQQDHTRTAAYLRRATATDLDRRARVLEGYSASAHEMATFGLVAHLEIHLDQLERTMPS